MPRDKWNVERFDVKQVSSLRLLNCHHIGVKSNSVWYVSLLISMPVLRHLDLAATKYEQQQQKLQTSFHQNIEFHQ